MRGFARRFVHARERVLRPRVLRRRGPLRRPRPRVPPSRRDSGHLRSGTREALGAPPHHAPASRLATPPHPAPASCLAAPRDCAAARSDCTRERWLASHHAVPSTCTWHGSRITPGWRRGVAFPPQPPRRLFFLHADPQKPSRHGVMRCSRMAPALDGVGTPRRFRRGRVRRSHTTRGVHTDDAPSLRPRVRPVRDARPTRGPTPANLQSDAAFLHERRPAD